MQVGILRPEAIPYGYLGPVGDYLHYINHANPLLLRLVLAIVVVIHVMEGIYAFVLTR